MLLGAATVCAGKEPSYKEVMDRGRAETLSKEAQTLTASWNEAALQKAVDDLEQARSLWHKTRDTQKEIEALKAMGEIFINLSQYPQALNSYQQQLSLGKRPSDRIKALNGLSLTHIYLGDQNRALMYCKQAERLSRATGDQQGEAESLVNAGEIHYFLGEAEKALQIFKHALSLWPEKNWAERSRALVNAGYAYFDLRQMDNALDYYEESLTQSRSEGNRRGEASALRAIGGVYSYQGNKQMAFQYHSDAVSLFRVVGDRNGEAVALNGLGYVYRNLADYTKSLDCYLRALEIFRALGNREYENFTLTRVGKAYEGLGDNAKALEYYKLAFSRTVKYPQTRVNALNSIGTVLESMGNPREAMPYYRSALSIYKTIKDKMGEAATLNNLGRLFATFGRREAALRQFSKALMVSRGVQDRRGEVSILLNIAKTQNDAEDYVNARRTVEDSLRLIESLRSEVASPALRASYFASVRQHYELNVDILMRSAQRDSGRSYAEDAFAVSERARARSFLEMLYESQINIREGVDPALIEQAKSLVTQLNVAAERYSALLASQKTEEAAAMGRQVDELSAQNEAIEAEINSRSPRYAALTHSQPLTVKEVQTQLLDDDSVLLEYMLGDQRSYVWAVTRTEVTTYQLPSRAEIEAPARKFYEALSANVPLPGATLEQHQQRLAEANMRIQELEDSLGKLLVEPASAKLQNKRLIIVPDGALQYIPFQALTISSRTNDARIPLLVEHEIVYEPSASTLGIVLAETRQRHTAPNSIAVFANPVFEANDARVRNSRQARLRTESAESVSVRESFRDVGFEEGKIPALPASREEAEAIMSLAPWGTGLSALGFDANRAAVMKPELTQYRIIHFATHGLIDYQRPELSGLVLSLVDQNGLPQDGFLRLNDIYNLRLSANLVVLSACNTGLGKEVKGEGLIGLTRGFMYAGAKGVVASLWKVDDEATAELMKLFYEGMFRRGLTPAAALREAQLSMWRQKRWQAPYYWAAFVIQGQYNQNEVVPAGFVEPWLVVATVLLTLAMVGAFLVFRKRRRRIISSRIGAR
jgi:CHAT domain-containing protein/tetratricopeptide (TPR) repeat protein